MTTLMIGDGADQVPYRIGEGTLPDLAGTLADTMRGRRAFVVSDANVGPLYGEGVAARLGASRLWLPAGEETKRWRSVERIARWLLAEEADRSSLLLAIGGGVITDLVGFAAAVTMRGLPWAAVPTTLLAMVDAALGGKTGIDLDEGKNLIGAFWPPKTIVADTLTLATLDRRQLHAGLAEVIKTAMVAPSSLEHVVDSHLGPVAAGDPLQAQELIVGCARIKSEIVALDAREEGPRRALNLGHTLAHGIEAASAYTGFLHGEAVAWGLLAELRLARDRGMLSTAEALAWADRIGLIAPLPGLEGLSWDELAPYIARDKKRQGGRVGWVLPRLGGVVLDVEIGGAEAAAVYAELRALPPEGPFTALF